MIDALTGEDLFAYIMMLRPQDSRYFLICEGPSDCAVLDPHLKEQSVESIPGYGKKAVLEAIELVREAKIPGVVALVDRDWDARSIMPDIIIHTDYYDIDATVFFAGDVFKRVLSNFADRQSVRDFCEAYKGLSPADAVISLALPTGILRKQSCLNGWGLRIEGISFTDVVPDGTVEVDFQCLVDASWSRSKGARVSQSDLQEIGRGIRVEYSNCPRDRESCCGHDLSSAFMHLLKRHWGGRAGAGTLEMALRASFSCHDALATRMFHDIPIALSVEPSEIFTCLDSVAF